MSRAIQFFVFAAISLSPIGLRAAEASSAEHKKALIALQALLEELATDLQDPQAQRILTLRALARVRVGLQSWAQSGPYYTKLLAAESDPLVCGYILAGLNRAHRARHGHLGVARDLSSKGVSKEVKANGVAKRAVDLANQAAQNSAKQWQAYHSKPLNKRRMPRIRRKRNEAVHTWHILAVEPDLNRLRLFRVPKPKPKKKKKKK